MDASAVPASELHGGASVGLWYRIKKYKIAYLWIAPFFIIFLVFWAWPIMFTVILSFQKWELVGDKAFIGLRNYVVLFRDEFFWLALRNNLFYWFAIVPLRTFLILMLAAMLNAPKTRFKGFFRASYVLPFITSQVFVALLFRVILAEEGGWVNVLLTRLTGIQPIPWLVSADWSKISVSVMTYWNTFGYFTVIMIGGLQRISRDLYESAFIDGASAVRIFFAITIPLAAPTILFVVIISTIRTFALFEGPLVLTQGGPYFSSTPLTMYLFQNGFDYFKMGYASGIAMVIFVIILSFSLVQMKVLGGGEE